MCQNIQFISIYKFLIYTKCYSKSYSWIFLNLRESNFYSFHEITAHSIGGFAPKHNQDQYVSRYIWILIFVKVLHHRYSGNHEKWNTAAPSVVQFTPKRKKSTNSYKSVFESQVRWQLILEIELLCKTGKCNIEMTHIGLIALKVKKRQIMWSNLNFNKIPCVSFCDRAFAEFVKNETWQCYL